MGPGGPTETTQRRNAPPFERGIPMSAFIVTENTIKAAVRAIVAVTGEDWAKDQLNTLGQGLWRLNRAAVEQRYGTSEGDDLPDSHIDTFDMTGHRGNADPSTLAMADLRALHTLEYQCDEGGRADIPLFDILQLAVEQGDQIAKAAYDWQGHIGDLPAYRDAPSAH